MAEQNEGAEKTLDPSDKKLEKAKEDGNILQSKEMFVFGSTLPPSSGAPVAKSFNRRMKSLFF